jgi:signal peptidase I
MSSFINRYIPGLTAGFLAAFVAYIVAWYFSYVEGNFALLLFCACVVTGVYWLAERFYFLPQRKALVQTLEQQHVQKQAENERLSLKPDAKDADNLSEARSRLIMQPWWLDWTAGLFPVIFAVFMLRSFLFEPFKIPSGSMIPTLHIGDLILVNKYHYGVRLPVLNKKITEGNPVKRGDVLVFRYPPKPSQDYIKRVIGLPGDEVAYIDKQITINGELMSKTSLPDFFDEDLMSYTKQFEEVLAGKRHRVLVHDQSPAGIDERFVADFALRGLCNYSAQGVRCKVPEGHYFVMGDNRDNSLDSRYWGFVPEANIVGKAFFVWMNFSSLKRIGSIE